MWNLGWFVTFAHHGFGGVSYGFGGGGGGGRGPGTVQ